MNIKLGSIATVALIALSMSTQQSVAQPLAGYPSNYGQLIEGARKEAKLVVYSVLSNKAAAPLVNDFRALYPDVKVEYDGESGSTEIYDRFKDEVGSGKPSADVLWSSAMDLQMKLVEDGYALTYRSPEAGKLPSWATYKNLAYGTTFEPVVFIYNKQFVSADEVPRDRASLVKLLASKPEKYRGKVTTFDIEKSGVGFMFAVQDQKLHPEMDTLLRAFGAADFRASPGTGTMLTKVASGEYLLGYNMMGAYAMVRAKKDLPGLGVVIPTDYTQVLSRVMFISKHARSPNAAKLWTDYVLSARGQKVIGDSLELFAIRNDVDAEYTAAKLSVQIGRNAKPIPLSAEITLPLEATAHRTFLTNYKAAVAAGAAR